MGLVIDLRVNGVEDVGFAWVKNVGGDYGREDRADYEVSFWRFRPASSAQAPDRIARLVGFDRSRGAVALAAEALAKLTE